MDEVGIVEDYGFVPRVRRRGEEKRELEKKTALRAKRWIVEALYTWLKRFRKHCPRYEKTVDPFCALLTLTMGTITFNEVIGAYITHRPWVF